MRNTIKILVFAVLVLAVLLIVPSISNAADITAEEGNDLVQIISNAETNSTITLNADFEISNVIEVVDKTITINGNGHTISGNMDALNLLTGPNKTLISASVGSNVTLENLKLTSSPKYGAQAYNGGTLVLNNVDIRGCNFGGVLDNGGVVEIIDLTLGFNGTTTNNGIEMGKGSSLEGQNVEPVLLMNGTLKSDQTENVIYIAENDEITSFKVQNIYDTTSDKIYVDGNKIVITDKDNSLKFESNSSSRVEASESTGDMYMPNPVITLDVPNMDPISFEIKLGSYLSEEELSAKIDLSNTNLKIDGFFVNENYETAFDFRGEIQGDITIYVKLSEVDLTEDPETPVDEEEPTEEEPVKEQPAEEEKDDTPKTGVSNYMGIAVAIVVVSLATIFVIKKKMLR